MSDIALMPDQVPLPLDDEWRRKVYAHYIEAFQRLDTLIVLSIKNFGLEQEVELARKEVLVWRKYLRAWASDDPILAEHEQHLSLLAKAMARDIATVQLALAQFPAMHYFTFDQAERFVCRRCSFETNAVRVAYYHGYLDI